MRIVRRLTSAEIAALATVAVVGVVLLTTGETIFSSGPLNAKSRHGVALGGVTSHAEIGKNCAACHAPPWSNETMAGRCLNCHTDIRKQFDTRGSMHGLMPQGK